MRIVVATAVYYPMINGVANFSRNLAEGLARRGHEVLVIAPSQDGKNHEEIVNGVKVAYLHSVQIKVYPDQIHELDDRGVKAELKVKKEKRKAWRKKWHFPWYRHGFRVSVFPGREIKRVLDRFQPDVVHVQVSDPIGLSVVGYAKKHQIPVVTTEHNQPEVLTASLHLGFLKRPANYFLAIYFRNRQRKSDFVTMPTKKAIYDLLDGHRELRVPIAAVSNGVDLSHFTPGWNCGQNNERDLKQSNGGETYKESSGRPNGEFYEKYGLSRDEQYALYVGRVDPEKKVGTVIDAFEKAVEMIKIENGNNKKARQKLPKLLIVGDGTDRARLEKKAERMGNEVRFLGKVLPPDLYDIYKVGEIFVTASEVETQGIVLIEAAATGLPLVAVDKGAVSEICKDGENGYLCQAGNVTEMANAIYNILMDESLREKFAEKSVEIAGEHDLEKTLDKFINIYRHVMSDK